jgi:dTDP-4-dehydrorhamnose 3,5-epimerase
MSVVKSSVSITGIPDLLYLTPKSITDTRGTVRELFRASTFPGAKIWQQTNLTRTEQGAVRGMHGESMTKLVGVVVGTAFAAYVDARPGSRSYGKVETRELKVGDQVLVPPGVCNGFQATSEGGCEYLYLFDVEWAPDLPGVAINPLDPDLGIAWPLVPILSDKDASAPRFSELGAR